MYLTEKTAHRIKVSKWVKKLEEDIEVVGNDNKLGISPKELEAAIKEQYRNYYSDEYSSYLNSFLYSVFNYIGIITTLIEIEAETSDEELAEIINTCNIEELKD